MKTPQSKSTKLELEDILDLYAGYVADWAEGYTSDKKYEAKRAKILALIESKVLEGRRDELGKLGGLNLYNQPTGYKANKKLHAHIEKRLEYFERALINKSCPICRKEDLDPEWLKAHLKTHAELEATPTNKEQD